MSFTIENLVGIISLLFAAIGGGFALYQWRKSLQIKRAEFLDKLIDKIRFDPNISEALYYIDYNPLWYDRSFHGSDKEQNIDRLFSYLDYICYLHSTNIIKDVDFKIFKYHIFRVLKTGDKYLWNLYHYSSKNGTPCAFQNLIEFGINNDKLPEAFTYDKTLYTKHLNF